MLICGTIVVLSNQGACYWYGIVIEISQACMLVLRTKTWARTLSAIFTCLLRKAHTRSSSNAAARRDEISEKESCLGREIFVPFVPAFLGEPRNVLSGAAHNATPASSERRKISDGTTTPPLNLFCVSGYSSQSCIISDALNQFPSLRKGT